jgi:dephospho-CoA kinase
LGHEVLEDPQVVECMRARWGAGISDAAGRIDRTAVARVVFAPPPDGPRELTYLEQITHPRIGDRIRQLLSDWSAGAEVPVVILDAAVLLEAGWDQWCDRIVFVQASRETRWRRARARGWNESQFAAREEAQMPLEEKRRRADWVVVNDCAPAETAAQIQQIWRLALEIAGPQIVG